MNQTFDVRAFVEAAADAIIAAGADGQILYSPQRKRSANPSI